MKNQLPKKNEAFEDYTFAIAWILFFAPLVIQRASLMSVSWIVFMFAWMVCEIKDAYDARRRIGGVCKPA